MQLLGEFATGYVKTMRERSRIGSHRLFEDGPILMLEVRGVVSGEQALAATTIYKETIAAHGRMLLLLDFSGWVRIELKARKALVEFGREYGHLGTIAVVGANMFSRGLLIILLNAVRLLSGKDVDVAFFPTQAQGLARLQERRAAMRVESKPA